MLTKKILQALTEQTAIREFDQSLVEHDANADIPALQRNDPRPPTVAHEMVCRRAAHAMASLGPHRKFLRQFPAVPILDAAPTRPDRRRWMFGIGLPPTLLARKQSREAGSIHDPARANCLRLNLLSHLHAPDRPTNPHSFCGRHHAESRPSPPQQDCRRRARQGAADNDYIVIRTGWHAPIHKTLECVGKRSATPLWILKLMSKFRLP